MDMTNAIQDRRGTLRLAAFLLLGGQVGYIAVTQLHAGGHANDHHEIFETYAHDVLWSGVHLGQFAAMGVLVAGLLVLAAALGSRDGVAGWLSRFGAAAAVTTLTLYAALQAVDGVALKQAVTAWANAPEAEQAGRFAAAEAIRWLEWGMRGYQDFALGAALLLFAGAMATTRWLPRALGPVVGLSGLAYLAQGWIAGTEGFSPAQSVAIVLGWGSCLVWIVWLAVAAWRLEPRRGSVAAAMEDGALPTT
jgi:hypothetical protein